MLNLFIVAALVIIGAAFLLAGIEPREKEEEDA